MNKRQTLTGDWDQFQVFMKAVLPKMVQKASEEISISVATRTAGEIKKLIRAYPIIDTAEYLKEVNAYKDEESGTWYAGVRDIDHAGPVNMRLLAFWLEYGTHNPDGSWKMYPRPHYRKANQMLPRIVARVIIDKGFSYIGMK